MLRLSVLAACAVMPGYYFALVAIGALALLRVPTAILRG